MEFTLSEANVFLAMTGAKSLSISLYERERCIYWIPAGAGMTTLLNLSYGKC
jgi:hypothetical protein